MGDHIFNKKDPNKHHKKVFGENQDIGAKRRQKVSFKAYMQQIEEDLLADELDDATIDLEDQDE
jgi:hypothetical protein